SALGRGSTFLLQIPMRYAPAEAAARQGELVLAAIDETRLLVQWERFLEGSRYRLIPAATLDEARAALARGRPAVIIAAPFLGGLTTRPLLTEVRKDPATRDVPVLGLARAPHEERLLALAADLIVDRLDGPHELLEALA